MTPEEEKFMPPGYCPNCWGEYEYDNMIRIKLEDKQVDVNNHKKVKTFIEEFADKHVKGIKLKAANDSHYCPSCMTNYRQIDGTEEPYGDNRPKVDEEKRSI